MISSKLYNPIFNSFSADVDIDKYFPVSIANGGFGGANKIETGAWTPVLLNCSYSYNWKVSSYYRISNLVYIVLHFSAKIWDTNNSYSEISGLPFKSLANSGLHALCMAQNQEAVSDGGNSPSYIYEDTTKITIRQPSTSGMGVNRWKNGDDCRISLSGWYRI